jgi:NADH-quinone oxidoreductase subunit L
MNLESLPWIILFLPLLAAAGITLFTRHDRKLSAGLSIAAVVIGFILSFAYIVQAHLEPVRESSVTWLSVGDLQADFGLRLDALSLLMMLMVTGVASAIHIYSWGYMQDDPGFSRFFACLSLFTFSMLGIVLSNNFLQLFIFWELVGVSSYLLIGFWFEKDSAADAGKKAFLTNRLGDFGFILGILTIWLTLHSLRFSELEKIIADGGTLGTAATVAGLLVFCGAMGKSAQFPLHVWLPDAMEGPTPVSALIHAATMVAAGVYMLCRVIFLMNAPALEFISWVGAFTALLAALIAVQQNDIKRILAYSTLSQLGYMVMAVGLHGPTQAMFHLTTHAFFKALLFLGAGSVIVAMHHEQDIWRMGGLRKKLPVTFWTFIAGTLALAGFWPLSGFFSKDAILAKALEDHHTGLFGIGLFVALLTSFYMFRLVFVVFAGEKRSESAGHAHESPQGMLWPLRFLATLGIIGGVIGIEQAFEGYFSGHGIEAVPAWYELILSPWKHAAGPAAMGLTAALVGLGAAWALYGKAAEDPLPSKLGALSRAMRNRFYFDELYEETFIRFHDYLAGFANFIDMWIVGGAVRVVHGTTELTGRALRMVQTGNLQTYAFIFAMGAAVVLFFMLK